MYIVRYDGTSLMIRIYSSLTSASTPSHLSLQDKISCSLIMKSVKYSSRIFSERLNQNTNIKLIIEYIKNSHQMLCFEKKFKEKENLKVYNAKVFTVKKLIYSFINTSIMG